jgi:hypothetical protein
VVESVGRSERGRTIRPNKRFNVFLTRIEESDEPRDEEERKDLADFIKYIKKILARKVFLQQGKYEGTEIELANIHVSEASMPTEGIPCFLHWTSAVPAPQKGSKTTWFGPIDKSSMTY